MPRIPDTVRGVETFHWNWVGLAHVLKLCRFSRGRREYLHVSWLLPPGGFLAVVMPTVNPGGGACAAWCSGDQGGSVHGRDSVRRQESLVFGHLCVYFS